MLPWGQCETVRNSSMSLMKQSLFVQSAPYRLVILVSIIIKDVFVLLTMTQIDV